VRGKPPSRKDSGVAGQGPKAHGPGTIVAARSHARGIRVMVTHPRPATWRLQVPPPRADWPVLRRLRLSRTRLIVELDGGQHADRPEDGARDSELCVLGYRVIRFWNDDIIDNLDGVLETLQSELEKWPLTHPLPASGAREMERVFSVTEYPRLNRHRPEEPRR